jgi:trk system potassium uptake protein TrkH
MIIVAKFYGKQLFFVIAFIFIMVALMFTGLDQVSSFSATAASINNLGPALGEVATNYSGISDSAKWILQKLFYYDNCCQILR